jgi:hypothetical protein
MNLTAPEKSGKFFVSGAIVSFPTTALLVWSYFNYNGYVANNLRFSLSSTTDFIVSISRKMPKTYYFSTVWIEGPFANKLEGSG